MSPELGSNPPDDLEARLLSHVSGINAWAEARQERGSNDKATLRKLSTKLEALTQEFRDTAVYIQAPLVLVPMEDGSLGVGMGEVTGEVVGFTYQEFPTISDQLEEGATKKGVVAIIATGATNMLGVTPKAWDLVIPEAASATMGDNDDYTKKGVVPLLVPITGDMRITQIENSMPLHLNTSHVLKTEAPSPINDYREHVARIEQLTKGKLTMSPEADRALMSALLRELSAMNSSCPYLGQTVKVSADYMRTPSLKNKDGFSIASGSVVGILRKFVYEPYFPDESRSQLRARGTVQAVIYQPEIAAAVYAGQITPQEADATPGTLKVPLDQEHTLEPLD